MDIPRPTTSRGEQRRDQLGELVELSQMHIEGGVDVSPEDVRRLVLRKLAVTSRRTDEPAIALDEISWRMPMPPGGARGGARGGGVNAGLNALWLCIWPCAHRLSQSPHAPLVFLRASAHEIPCLPLAYSRMPTIYRFPYG